MEALEFLMKMSLVVFESFLQRPKDVVFEGLSEEGLVIEVENGEKDEEEEEERMQREVREFENKRENDMKQKMKMDGCVVVCGRSLLSTWGEIFSSFCCN